MKFYYSHGRTAFKYGLKYLGVKKNDHILIPEYLCDILLDPLDDLDIKPVFYKIRNDFSVDYQDIKKKYNKKVKVLLIINFFGFEEEKKRYFNFCKKNKIFLIEDHCHSLKNSPLNKKYLPDIAFYSVHKMIKKIYSGGVLEIFNKKGNMKNLKQELKSYNISFKEYIKNFFENNLSKFKFYLKTSFLKIPNYEKIDGIKNKKILGDYSIDKYSLKILKSINHNKIQKQRLKNYKRWIKFCKKNKNFFLINRELRKNTTPWLLPIFVKNKVLRKKLFKYGWENGYSITSWPSLPTKQINKRTKKIWDQLVCFNTDKAPSDDQIQINNKFNNI